MTKEQLSIAKEALHQYELMRIRQIESLPQVEFQPSEKYIAKKEELREQIRNKTLKTNTLSSRQKICILIASALIMALIATACVFGNQIKGFFVNFFDSFATADYVDDSPNLYKDYKLTWLPENYKEKNESYFNNSVQTTYSDNEKLIYFMCNPISYFYSVIDTQRSDFEIIDSNDIEIYCKVKNNAYTIYWVDDDVSFRIQCDTSIEWSDIEKMILSVKCEE